MTRPEDSEATPLPQGSTGGLSNCQTDLFPIKRKTRLENSINKLDFVPVHFLVTARTPPSTP